VRDIQEHNQLGRHGRQHEQEGETRRITSECTKLKCDYLELRADAERWFREEAAQRILWRQDILEKMAADISLVGLGFLDKFSEFSEITQQRLKSMAVIYNRVRAERAAIEKSVKNLDETTDVSENGECSAIDNQWHDVTLECGKLPGLVAKLRKYINERIGFLNEALDSLIQMRMPQSQRMLLDVLAEEGVLEKYPQLNPDQMSAALRSVSAVVASPDATLEDVVLAADKFLWSYQFIIPRVPGDKEGFVTHPDGAMAVEWRYKSTGKFGAEIIIWPIGRYKLGEL
jgi:hypothetical protein